MIDLVNSLRLSWEFYRKNRDPFPEGEEGLAVRTHRQMVGSKWDQLGELQLSFLMNEGLRPDHTFCDVACGSFRAGRLLIPYLDRGNYLAIEKQKELVDAGRKYEIPEEVWDAKEPEILIDDRFSFSRFSKPIDVAIAQSLFTHLTMRDITRCLSNLKPQLVSGGKLYATYVPPRLPNTRIFHIQSSHASRHFRYTYEQMEMMGQREGYEVRNVGNWGHPHNQLMICYEKA